MLMHVPKSPLINGVWTSTNVLRQCCAGHQWAPQKGAAARTAIAIISSTSVMKAYGVGVPGSLYERCTGIRSSNWFGLADCCGRLARVLVAYYWLVLSHPPVMILQRTFID